MIRLVFILIAILLIPGFIQIATHNMKLHKIQKNKTTNNNKTHTYNLKNKTDKTDKIHKTSKIHKIKDYNNYNDNDIIQSCMKYMENKKSSIFIVDTEDKNIFEYDKYEFIKNKIKNKDNLNIEDFNELISLIEDEL